MNRVYVKLNDNKIIFPPTNYKGINNYNLREDLLKKDKWKLLKRVDSIDEGYYVGYKETETEIQEVLLPITKPTEEEQELQKEIQFNQDFFNTSLGYVRREVHYKDGQTDKFLSDVLPLLEVGTPIITYNKDLTQNKNVPVTEQFIKECKQQKLRDFYGM